ncbi:MAG: STAS domain-containing protein [Thiolinea sp.]
MENSIRVHKQGKRTVITLSGLLDKDMATNLTNIISKSEPPTLLDMEQVSFISSHGSRAILEIFRQQQQKPLIKQANKHVLGMLHLSGTARYVELVPGQNR